MDKRKERSGRTGKEIKAIFWNVAGTAKMKAENWGYVRKFDIIGLAETREEKYRGRKAEVYLKEYVVKQKFAVREKKKGRAKGGILLAIRKGMGDKVEREER